MVIYIHNTNYHEMRALIIELHKTKGCMIIYSLTPYDVMVKFT